MGSIPGLGRSPGGGHGNSLQYSCLRNPWTEEPGGLQSMRSQSVRHDWATFTFTPTLEWCVGMLEWCMHIFLEIKDLKVMEKEIKIFLKYEAIWFWVFWPGEFHGLYSPCGHKESDTTEQLSLSFTDLQGAWGNIMGWQKYSILYLDLSGDFIGVYTGESSFIYISLRFVIFVIGRPYLNLEKWRKNSFHNPQIGKKSMSRLYIVTLLI